MRRLALAALVTALSACHGPPSPEEVADAQTRVSVAMAAADQVRTVLELLGILPVYTCGEPRRAFVGRAVEDTKKQYPCLEVSTSAAGEADLVTLVAPGAGCAVRGHALKGKAVFTYSGGEDRFRVDGDFHELEADGTPLTGKAGYGECGDEKQVFGSAEGTLASKGDAAYSVDLTAAIREGLPLIGGTDLILSGPGSVTTAPGTDKLTFTALDYEIGNYLPKEGTLLVETHDGTRVEATFTPVLWRLGQASVTVNDSDPVTVPVVR